MYRKFQSDRIFNGYDFLPADGVLIMAPSGEVADCVPYAEAGDDIQYLPGLLLPGFVNAHCHIELSHLKGLIPPHSGLVSFIKQVISGREANEEVKLSAMREAATTMYEAGTVAVGDICNRPDSIPVKSDSPLYWHNFIELSGFVPSTAENRLQSGLDLLQQFELLTGYSSAGLTAHAPYSVSKELLELLNRQTEGSLISVHNQETMEEGFFFRDGSGQLTGLYQHLGISIDFFNPPGISSFRAWAGRFNHGQRVISVHNTFTSEDDIDFVQQHIMSGAIRNFYFCTCPSANAYIEQAVPPLDLLWASGLPVVIGTDSYASNTSLDMWTEIGLIRELFPRIPETVILQWATINGATALGIDARFGSFEKGKVPGVVWVNEGRSKRVF